MKTQEKIIEILSLLSTDKREEAIRAYIEYTIKKLANVSSASEIVDNTRTEFGLVLQVGEVGEEIQWLIENSRILNTGGVLSLSADADKEVTQLIKTHDKQNLEQYQSFCKEIQNINKGRLLDAELSLLYDGFEEYLYDCFLEYGRAATNIFNPETHDEEKLTKTNEFLKKVLSKVKKQELKDLLEKYIWTFNDNMTVKQAEYLDSLASKAESFFALGLSQDLHKEFKSIAPLDWTIFLDTNILYSILKLHSHIENEAIRAIISMNNKFKDVFTIKFKFLPLTYKELKLLRYELDRMIEKTPLNQKQLTAALASGRLDGYTKSYYENMLEHGANTPHPTNVIDKSMTSLKSIGIELYNRELFEGEETEEFKDKISAYNTYQQIRNEARAERGFEYKAPKSIDKIAHDITLREMILLLRHNDAFEIPVEVSECKIYGLTIDKVLMDFDKYELNKPSNKVLNFIPTFFFPSYLLKRMYRYLPVQTENYRKSFLSSISSPLPMSNGKDSRVAQKALAYFHALGVDDTDFIINSLTSDLFIQKINQFDGNSAGAEEFIASEINQAIQDKSKEIEKNNQKISSIERKLKSSNKKTNEVFAENEGLKLDKLTLEQNVGAFSAAIEKLNSQLKKVQKAQQAPLPVQTSLPFSDEKDYKIKELEKQLEQLSNVNKKNEEAKQIARAKRIKEYKNRETVRWQKEPLTKFYILVGFVTFILSCAIVLVLIKFHGNFHDALAGIKSLFENEIIAWVGGGVVALLAFIGGGVFMKEHLSRREMKNYEIYFNQVDIPSDFE